MAEHSNHHQPEQNAEQLAPPDTRYEPVTQLPYCCLAACLEMTIFKHSDTIPNIPTYSQEEIAVALGLTVPPEYADTFKNARVSTLPPTEAGFGTQIHLPEFEPNAILRNQLHLPVQLNPATIDCFTSLDDMRAYLTSTESSNAHLITCFNYGNLYSTNDGGHFCVFDRYNPETDKVRLIDPDPNVPKWRSVSADNLFRAMQYHGSQNSGGFIEVIINQANK